MRSKLSRQQPWFTRIQLNFRLCFFGVQMLCFFGSTSLNHAALLWEYSSTDGTSTLSGTFETDGTYQDSQAGLVEFKLTEFKTIVIDGNDLTETVLPSILPRPDYDRFQWDGGIDQVVGFPDESAMGSGTIEGSSVRGSLRIAFPLLGTSTSRLFFDLQGQGSVIFSELSPTTQTTLTPLAPVPEVEEYAAAMLLSVSAFVLWRRRQRGQQIYSTKQDHVVLPPC